MADSGISLTGSNAILGRTIVVHELQDDLGQGRNQDSLKNGNAGPPVACGIIGISAEQARQTKSNFASIFDPQFQRYSYTPYSAQVFYPPSYPDSFYQSEWDYYKH